MNKNKNMNSLFLTLAIVLPVLAAIFFVKFTAAIPWYVLLIGVLLIEEFYVVPIFTINYYKLYGQDLGSSKWKAFIPIYNYIMTFGKVSSILTIVTFVVFLLSSISTLVPSVFTFMGDRFILRFSSTMPTVIIVEFTILNVILGVSFYKNSNNVNKYFHMAFPNEGSYKKLGWVMEYLPFLEVFLYILPIFRIIPLLSCIDKEVSMTSMKLDVDTIKEISKEEEEDL